MNIDKKKTTILSVITVITLVLLLVGASYAYFQAQGGVGSAADVRVTTYTTDLLTFTTGDDIAIYADQANFADGLGNQSGTTFAKAHLLANSKTNSATANYYVYLYIPDNSFVYTQDDNTPELLLQVTNPDGVQVTSIDGLDYKTVTDGKGQTIKGFDITTKLGMLTLVNNHEIIANPEIQETWNINVVFVNLDADQNLNTGKDFRGQLIITKDNYDDYTPAMVHTISTSIEDSNLTVSVNASEGTEGIAKYYYAIKENNAVAMNASKVTKLSNILAVNNLEYIESDSNTYTFTNINANSNYEVYTYVVDGKETTSNIYNTKVNGDSVVLPSISKVEVTDETSTTLTVSVTAIAGTNAINKYYYSIDNGKTYVESTNSTYKFSNLVNGTSYSIKIKVSDTNDNYSYEYSYNKEFLYTLADWVIAQYDGVQGNNNIYYHDGTIKDNDGNVIDAGDNSYRYAGSSETTNNFVCFGSDTEPCPTDNLYRIIGVFGGQVKLIKWDYANSDLLGEDGDYNSNTYLASSYSNYTGSKETINEYYWNYANQSATYNAMGYYNAWNYSQLNTVNLNINFLNNIGTKWANKIATATWKVGGGIDVDIRATNAKMAYIGEITGHVIRERAKVALMYVSEYYYGSSPIYWTYPGWSRSGASNDYRAAIGENWMYMGLSEWTVVPRADVASHSFILSSSGHILTYGVKNSSLAVRPVFYLKPDVIKVGDNTGTKTDPIRIS